MKHTFGIVGAGPIVRGAGLAVLLPLAVGSGLDGQDEGREMTLAEALEMAQVHSPQLAQSQANLSNAGSSRRRAWGSFPAQRQRRLGRVGAEPGPL